MKRALDIAFLDMASPEFSTRSDAVREARKAFWCARTPYGYAVLRHREVGLLLRDKRLRQGSFAWPEIHRLEGSFSEFWKRSIISLEADSHRQMRDLAVPALAPDYVTSLKPEFDRIAERLVEELIQNERCEFMADFSVPFAGQAICVLLGLQTEDWKLISNDASDLGLAMGVECKSHEPIFNAACDRLTALAEKLIERAQSGEDEQSFVARLVARANEMGNVSHQALLDMVVIAIFGGVDTTRAQLGFAMGLFIDHPDQWRMLRADPTLVGNAVEEIIRARPTTTWATRRATENFEFEDVKIKEGETLHMLVHASARDEAICDNQEFDIAAKRKIHFGFGGGAHHCLGHQVARSDMASALSALARKLVRFSFDGEPEYLPDSGNTSPVRLPLRLEIG